MQFYILVRVMLLLLAVLLGGCSFKTMTGSSATPNSVLVATADLPVPDDQTVPRLSFGIEPDLTMVTEFVQSEDNCQSISCKRIWDRQLLFDPEPKQRERKFAFEVTY